MGLTPLALANKLGKHQVFNEILELHRVELWRFSNVNCSVYPIHAVDSIAYDGKMSKLLLNFIYLRYRILSNTHYNFSTLCEISSTYIKEILY